MADLEVDLPCLAWVAVHDVAAGEPADVAVLGLVLLVLHEQQRLLHHRDTAREGRREGSGQARGQGRRAEGLSTCL